MAPRGHIGTVAGLRGFYGGRPRAIDARYPPPDRGAHPFHPGISTSRPRAGRAFTASAGGCQGRIGGYHMKKKFLLGITLTSPVGRGVAGNPGAGSAPTGPDSGPPHGPTGWHRVTDPHPDHGHRPDRPRGLFHVEPLQAGGPGPGCPTGAAVPRGTRPRGPPGDWSDQSQSDRRVTDCPVQSGRDRPVTIRPGRSRLSQSAVTTRPSSRRLARPVEPRLPGQRLDRSVTG